MVEPGILPFLQHNRVSRALLSWRWQPQNTTFPVLRPATTLLVSPPPKNALLYIGLYLDTCTLRNRG